MTLIAHIITSLSWDLRAVPVRALSSFQLKWSLHQIELKLFWVMDILSRVLKNPLFPDAFIFVCIHVVFAYLQIFFAFLSTTAASGACICATWSWYLLLAFFCFLPPPCFSCLCSFAATMHLFLNVIVSEHNCKNGTDNNSCSLSIYHFPRCISLIYIQTCSRISQHSSVFVLLIVFRPLCRWISLLSVTSGLVAFSLSPTSIYVSAQLLCRQIETEVKVQIHRNTSLHCPQHPFMFQHNRNPAAVCTCSLRPKYLYKRLKGRMGRVLKGG